MTRSCLRRLLPAAFCTIIAVLWLPLTANGQTPPFTYEQYDVELDLLDNGDIDVTITQLLRFDGEFSTAFFEIPQDYTTAVSAIELQQIPLNPDGTLSTDTPFDPESLNISDSGDMIFVEWTYPQTRPGDRRAFQLSYRAEGALWRYPDRDFITWDAVSGKRSGVPVEESNITLNLPPTVPINDVRYNASGPRFDATSNGSSIRFTASELIPDGTPFTVAVTMPSGSIDAPVQDWQKEIDGETLALTVSSVAVDLTLNEDGTLDARERLALTVDESYLHQAFRILSLLYRDDISDIRLKRDGTMLRESDGPCPDCYTETRTVPASDWIDYDAGADQIRIDEDGAGSVVLRWDHPLLGPGSVSDIEIEYRVDGALRIDDDSQFLTWEVLPDYGIPVEEAEFTLHLPAGVAASDLEIGGVIAENEPRMPDESTVELTYRGSGETRPRWQVDVALPPDATTAARPAWQDALEEAQEEEEAARVSAARNQTFRRMAGIAAIAVGLAGLAFGRLRWGRRRTTERRSGSG